jgi:hypothetical protein
VQEGVTYWKVKGVLCYRGYLSRRGFLERNSEGAYKLFWLEGTDRILGTKSKENLKELLLFISEMVS